MSVSKIVIVIGASGSGKTTYIKNKYLTPEHLDTNPEKLIKCCSDGKTLLFGHYRINQRCCGCDTLSMGILPALINFIPKIIDKYETIVFDGDRINCKRFFDFIKSLKNEVELVLLSCPLSTSLARRQNTGSKASESFVRATLTKSNNMALYAQILGFKLIKINT